MLQWRLHGYGKYALECKQTGFRLMRSLSATNLIFRPIWRYHLTLYTRKTPKGVINLYALNDERCLMASWLQLRVITAQGE